MGGIAIYYFKHRRKAGILLHLTSLPSPYGIGDMGQNAYRFIDYLSECEQSYWQVLPLNPPGYGNSPYQCYSAFAGNPLLIDPEQLLKKGWLQEHDLSKNPDFSQTQIKFEQVKKFKNKLFEKAWVNFKKKEVFNSDQYKKFLNENQYWLSDYCFFMALKEYFNHKSWTEWPLDIAQRKSEAIHKYQKQLQSKINYHKFLQFVFWQQWQKLQNYALKKDVKMIGDIPIFVAHNSSDVWVNPELFKLDAQGEPTKVAGVPPDAFSETGQYWGNPVYRWDKMAANNYKWWKQRFLQIANMVEVVRLDHFRGFEAYWEIPAEAETAVSGKWVKGPGIDFFDEIVPELNHLQILAEDLGYITPEVKALKAHYGFPGMQVMQFMINPDQKFKLAFNKFNNYLYTGTHDNKTLWQWYQDYYQKQGDLEKLKQDPKKVCLKYIDMAYKSPALKVIIPLQDFMGLGAEARINQPGTVGGNWEWRFTWNQLQADFKEKLKKRMSQFERN